MKVYMVDSHWYDGRNDFSVEKEVIGKAGHEFILERCKNDEEIVARCADADAVLALATAMGAECINALPNLKLIVRYGIGYDVVDIKAASAKGVKVCNIPDYCYPEVAIHSLSLILACTRNLLNFAINVRVGKYKDDIGAFYKMRRPSNQTVGIIGFGNIARTLCGYLKALEYNVIAYDPYLDNAFFTNAGVTNVTLDELLSNADIITLHTPYTEETHHIINKDSIAKMKNGIVIVNAARGPLICEEDLVDALETGKVGAAGLDVFEKEPFKPQDHPFYHMNNVFLTPHTAFSSAESSVELYKQVAVTTVDVLAGKVTHNIVNKKDLGL